MHTVLPFVGKENRPVTSLAIQTASLRVRSLLTEVSGSTRMFDLSVGKAHVRLGIEGSRCVHNIAYPARAELIEVESRPNWAVWKELRTQIVACTEAPSRGVSHCFSFPQPLTSPTRPTAPECCFGDHVFACRWSLCFAAFLISALPLPSCAESIFRAPVP